MSGCISDVAVAVVEALQDKSKATATSSNTVPVSTGISPVKCIDVCMKILSSCST